MSEQNEENEEYLEYPENGKEEEEFEFLQELTNTHYFEKKVMNEKELKKIKKEENRHMKQLIQQQKQEEKRQIRLNKEEEMRQKKELKNKNKTKINVKDKDTEDNFLFDEEGTELMGRDRLIVSKQIYQYKILFPKELNKFKLKKNASLVELNASLEECKALIEINSVDVFVLDSILSCCKMMEGYTVESDYDISGLSTLLKSNPQVNSLSRQLFIKYHIFSSVPIEYQLMMCIVSTSYLCIQKNKGRASINSYLNQQI